jgi:hypothetical protein
LHEALAEGEDVALIRALIDAALAGDRVAVRFLAARLMPKPRGRAVDLGIPIDATTTHEQIFDAALAKMAAGEITPEEAALVAKLLHDRRTKFAGAGEADPAAVPAAAPAFDLQTAGEAAAGRAAAPAAAKPANRHERRRAAALQRAAASRMAPTAPLAA